MVEPRVRLFPWGMNKGTPVIEVVWNEGDIAEEMIAKIEALKFPQRETDVWLLNTAEDSNDPERYALVTTLRDLGYPIISQVSGGKRFLWQSFVTWLVVMPLKERWLKFRCNELVWAPTKPLANPPEMPANKATVFLWVKGEGASEWVLKQPMNWRVME